MKEIGTLRQLIWEILENDPGDGHSLRAILDYLCKKDKKTIGSKVTKISTNLFYIPVIDELYALPRTKPNKMPILVQWTTDDLEEPPVKYVDVCLLNLKYKAPKEGLRPWGCHKGKKPPKGHYDVNAEKHNQYFAFGFSSWSEIIDTPILDDTSLEPHEILAEILWELTFYGWTQKDVKKEMDKIEGSMEQAMKEIKEGKYVKLPKKTDKGFDVVIPESVMKQLKELK